MDIILQFNNKIKNDSNLQKHKSEFLKFYVQRNKTKLKVLDKDELKKLMSVYENLEFYNINKQYGENENDLDDNLLDFIDFEYD